MSARTRQAAERAKARADAEKALARRQRQVRIAVVVALAAVGAAFIALTTVLDSDPKDAASPGTEGLLTGPPPWPSQADGLAARIAPLNFPPPGDESYHAHVLLSVFRDGQQVAVPENLGFDTRGTHSSLHTHTPDGVIHMEADDPYPYKLSDLFTTWGVAFGSDRLGGDVNAGDKKVHVYVNGKPAPAGPAVEMKDGDNIVVAYGAAGSFPKQPPADALERA